MKEACVVVKCCSYQSRYAHEVLNALLTLAVFEMPARIVFFDQGLTWLLPNQSPSQSKSLAKQLLMLPMYGQESIYYCQEHQQQSFPNQALWADAQPIPLTTLTRWIKHSTKVLVF